MHAKQNQTKTNKQQRSFKVRFKQFDILNEYQCRKQKKLVTGAVILKRKKPKKKNQNKLRSWGTKTAKAN